jgi:hypothetical protein
MLVNIFNISSICSSSVFNDTFTNLLCSNNNIQYFVSLASFAAIYNLETKSALICADSDSATFAPILVPLFKICFDIMYSFCSFKFL